MGPPLRNTSGDLGRLTKKGYQGPLPPPRTGVYAPLGRFNSFLEGTRVLLQRLALVKENLGILWTFL